MIRCSVNVGIDRSKSFVSMTEIVSLAQFVRMAHVLTAVAMMNNVRLIRHAKIGFVKILAHFPTLVVPILIAYHRLIDQFVHANLALLVILTLDVVQYETKKFVTKILTVDIDWFVRKSIVSWPVVQTKVALSVKLVSIDYVKIHVASSVLVAEMLTAKPLIIPQFVPASLVTKEIPILFVQKPNLNVIVMLSAYWAKFARTISV